MARLALALVMRIPPISGLPQRQACKTEVVRHFASSIFSTIDFGRQYELHASVGPVFHFHVWLNGREYFLARPRTSSFDLIPT
jgi:hypothetical protein